MALSYEPLWNFLNTLHISKMDFAKRIDISNATLAKLGKNEPVTLTIIEKICSEFKCNITDIVTHIPDPKDAVPINLLKMGVIVESPCFALNQSFRSRIQNTRHSTILPKHCVILTVSPEPTMHNRYLIAPMIFCIDPECIFDIPFTNARINGENKSGYIQLSKLGLVSSKDIERIIGNISCSAIESINSSILADIIQLIIKHHITPEALFYNLGLLTDK